MAVGKSGRIPMVRKNTGAKQNTVPQLANRKKPAVGEILFENIFQPACINAERITSRVAVPFIYLGKEEGFLC